MGPKCNYNCSYLRKAEGDLPQTPRREGKVKMVVQMGVMGPQSKAHQQPAEAGGARPRISPEFLKGSIIYIVLLLPSGGAPLGRIRGLFRWSDIIPQPHWPLGPVVSSFVATLEFGS